MKPISFTHIEPETTAQTVIMDDGTVWTRYYHDPPNGPHQWRPWVRVYMPGETEPEKDK